MFGDWINENWRFNFCCWVFFSENIRKNLSSVQQEEVDFQKSYSEWLKQFNDWKVANQSKYLKESNGCWIEFDQYIYKFV